VTAGIRLPRPSLRARLCRWGGALGIGLATALSAHADAVERLQRFVADVKGGRADFEQVVTSPDGVARKPSSGRFVFLRPDRFRFDYTKPFEQQIVSDGRKVWLHDPDLQQVTVRRISGHEFKL
jgi:outer membrane lipoprotein carrier protein